MTTYVFKPRSIQDAKAAKQILSPVTSNWKIEADPHHVGAIAWFDSVFPFGGLVGALDSIEAEIYKDDPEFDSRLIMGETLKTKQEYEEWLRFEEWGRQNALNSDDDSPF